MNLAELRKQILSAPTPVATDPFSAMSGSIKAVEIQVEDRLEAIMMIQDYLKGLFDKQPDSYFGMLLSTRSLFPSKISDKEQLCMKEAEFTAQVLGAIKVGLEGLGKECKDNSLSWRYFNQIVLLDYLLDMVVLPFTKPESLSSPHSDPKRTTQSLLLALSKDQDNEILILASDPNFLQGLIRRERFSAKEAPSITPRFKRRDSVSVKEKPVEKKEVVVQEAQNIQAQYVGKIQTDNYKLSRDTYITSVNSIDGTPIDKTKKLISHNRSHDELTPAQARITIPISVLSIDSGYGYKLPCPRGTSIVSVEAEGNLYRSDFNTYSFMPENDQVITYVVELDDSVTTFQPVTETSMFPLSRPETYKCDEIAQKTSNENAKVGLILSTARMLQPIYSIEPWVDAIIEASGSRRLLALEALQIFKCDTASEYLGMRLQQHGIECHVVSGICASEQGFNIATGHAEVEYKADEKAYRLSAGDITKAACRIPSVNIKQVEALVSRLPYCSDEGLFTQIMEFQASLPRDAYDSKQIEKEQAAFGQGAMAYDRAKLEEYTPEGLGLLIEIINEDMQLAKDGALTSHEFGVLIDRLKKYSEHHHHSDHRYETYLHDTYGNPLPKEIAQMFGYNGEKYQNNYTTIMIDLFQTTITNPKYESLIVNCVTPSLIGGRYYYSSRIQLPFFEALGIVKFDRVLKTPHSHLIAYRALRELGRHHSYKGGKYSEIIDSITDNLCLLAYNLPLHNSWSPPYESNEQSVLNILACQSIYLEHRDDLKIKIRAYGELIQKTSNPAEILVREIFWHEMSNQLPELLRFMRAQGVLSEHILPDGSISKEMTEHAREHLARRSTPPSLGDLLTLERCGFDLKEIIPVNTLLNYLNNNTFADVSAVKLLLDLPPETPLTDRKIAISGSLQCDSRKIEASLAIAHIIASCPDSELSILVLSQNPPKNSDEVTDLNEKLSLLPPDIRRELFHLLRKSLTDSDIPSDIRDALKLLIANSKILNQTPNLLYEFIGYRNSRYTPHFKGLFGYEARLEFLKEESTLDYGGFRDNYPPTAIEELMHWGLKLGEAENAKIYIGSLRVGSRETTAQEILRKTDGTEYYATREYVHGDSIRRIDWNATARSGQYKTKVYREPEPLNAELIIPIDQYVDGLAELDHTTKTKFITSWSQSVGWLYKHQDTIQVTYTFRGEPVIKGTIEAREFENKELLLSHLENLLFMLDQIVDTDARLTYLGVRYL